MYVFGQKRTSTMRVRYYLLTEIKTPNGRQNTHPQGTKTACNLNLLDGIVDFLSSRTDQIVETVVILLVMDRTVIPVSFLSLSRIKCHDEINTPRQGRRVAPVRPLSCPGAVPSHPVTALHTLSTIRKCWAEPRPGPSPLIECSAANKMAGAACAGAL